MTRENKRATLRALLIFLGRIMDDPSKLSPGKLNAAIAQAARLEARGWKYLAGEGGDIDELIALIGDPSLSMGDPDASLIRNRNVPDSHGRPAGSKEEKYADKDAAVIADIRKGIAKPAAIRARYPVRKQYVTHRRRIKRKMNALEAEEREIILLHTRLGPVDIK